MKSNLAEEKIQGKNDVVYKGDLSSGACFSACFTYRYSLWRHWNWLGDRYLVFLMLNPSTADHRKADPTVAGCIVRAKKWGFDGLYVLNLFALRSTDPGGLKKVKDPVGKFNNSFIASIANGRRVICAWGRHGSLNDRSSQVKAMLKNFDVKTYYLQLNSDGEPKHPLYTSHDIKPTRWDYD